VSGKLVTRERWSTRKTGQRKGGQRGKVVNAESWSTRKSGQRKTGQRGKVVNGKLVNAIFFKNIQICLAHNNDQNKIFLKI
jgi:hypothetical protein